jgi:hypothetical protein
MTETSSRPFDATTRKALFPLLNNLYWVHLDIVDVCSKWVPRRERDDERAWLATQLAREATEVAMYREMVEALGSIPDASYRINDSLVRYRRLKETDDDVEVLVGMNVLAQAVLGHIEHRNLLRFDPVFFAPFVETIAFDAGAWERARIAMTRRDPERLREQLEAHRRHMLELTIPELEPLLEPVIAVGVLAPDVFEVGIERYAEVSRQVGVELQDTAVP